MTNHLGLMALFACCVAIVFAVLMRDEPLEQVRLGAKLFAGMVGAGMVFGWLLYGLPW